MKKINITEINSTIEKTGESFSGISEWLINKIPLFGQIKNNFSSQVLTLIILAGSIFLATKIANKIVKIVLIILLIVLVISLFYSMLMGFFK